MFGARTTWHHWSFSVLSGVLADKVAVVRKMCESSVDGAVLLHQVARRYDECPEQEEPIEIWRDSDKGSELREVEIMRQPYILNLSDNMREKPSRFECNAEPQTRDLHTELVATGVGSNMCYALSFGCIDDTGIEEVLEMHLEAVSTESRSISYSSTIKEDLEAAGMTNSQI